MKCVRDLIIESAGSRPEQCAVESSYCRMTCRELVEFARRAAGKLERLQVGKGDFLTIELPRSAEYVGMMLTDTSGSTGRPKGVLLSHQSIHDSCVRGVAALKANEYAGEHFGAAIPFSMGISFT